MPEPVDLNSPDRDDRSDVRYYARWRDEKGRADRLEAELATMRAERDELARWAGRLGATPAWDPAWGRVGKGADRG